MKIRMAVHHPSENIWHQPLSSMKFIQMAMRGDCGSKLAEKHGVDEDALLFGNGSDEIIMIISRALLGKGTNTVMATPTFPQYAHNAKIEGAEIREIPLKEMDNMIWKDF